MSAGKVNAKKEEYPEVHAVVKVLCEELGGIWEAGEEKYDEHLMNNDCPFLKNEACSIYEIRPEGCRLFPKTAFGMESQDCEPLNRFKKMRVALKKGRTCRETYYFTGTSEFTEPVKPAKFTQKQYQAIAAKLRQAGMTDDELTFFNHFNGQNAV